MDTIKIRMQLSGSSDSPMQTFRKILIKESNGNYLKGFGRLYKGVVSPIWGTAPIVAICLSTNEKLNNLVKDWNISKSAKSFLWGFGAGSLCSLFVCPIDFLKIRKQAKGNKGLTYPEIIKSQVQSKGFIGMYQGFPATFLRCSYTNGMFFFCNYHLRRIMNVNDKDGHFLSFFKKFMAGGLAGQGYWLTGYPIDVIKSNIQNSNSNAGIIATARTLYQTKGIGVFYKGVSMACIRTFPFSAINIVVYEAVSKRLKRYA